MFKNIFHRNVSARDNFEFFLISAATSLLLLRFALYLAGYPQVGGGSLHIAHMLYGGLLMLAAITLVISFLGARVLRLAAIVGGVGFGIFIDELGKFLTKDNNYFFRPTIGIIYAIFIVLYLLFNFLSRTQRLSSQEYQLNALNQFEEAVLHDMDRLERARIRDLLARADQSSFITQELRVLLGRVAMVPTEGPNRFYRSLESLNRQYRRFWKRRGSDRLVGALFIVEAGLFVVTIFASIFNNFDDVRALLRGTDSYGSELIVGQLLASLVAAAFAVIGAVKLTNSRLAGFEWFRRATLINLLLTEFFIFSRIQFGAIPSFLANLALLLALRYAIYQEQRVRAED
ncbi:MAG: hypothetical protein ABI602_01275 [Candidatus Saccharibacteria bacterium]